MYYAIFDRNKAILAPLQFGSPLLSTWHGSVNVGPVVASYDLISLLICSAWNVRRPGRTKKPLVMDTPFEFEPGCPVMAVFSPNQRPDAGTMFHCFKTEQQAEDWRIALACEGMFRVIRSVEEFDRTFKELGSIVRGAGCRQALTMRYVLNSYRISADGKRMGL